MAHLVDVIMARGAFGLSNSQTPVYRTIKGDMTPDCDVDETELVCMAAAVKKRNGSGRKAASNGAAANKTVKLVIVHAVIVGHHRFNALSIGRADQPSHIGPAHPPARSMSKRIHERPKPALKLVDPIQLGSRHGQRR
jgi:hypothetical protein